MKVQFACLSVGLALAAGTMPASAADWGNGSRGGYASAAVAVPAPVPIPEYRPSWYFRFDAGLGIISEPDLSESGFIYGVDDAEGPNATRTIPSSFFSGDFSNLLTTGGGVGYYLGNGWRIDATVEKRSKDDVSISGSDEYETYGYDSSNVWALVDLTGPIGIPDGIADTHTRTRISDQSSIKGTVWTANAYYDLGSTHGFTPYLGAGLGFVWNQVSRTHNSTTETCDAQPATPNAGCGYIYNSVSSTTATNKSDTVSLAAALMAGLSYDISDMTSVDIGYRYLYLAGTSSAMSINGTESTLEIGDQHVHQMRAGLRFNVN